MPKPTVAEELRAATDLLRSRMTGPHDPESVSAAADMAAEAIRYLNLSTRPGQGGLESPADAYDLLGSLKVAVERMPQLCGQVGAQLRKQAAAGNAADREGRDPAIQAGMAADLLEDVAGRLDSAAAHLGRAQSDIAGLYVKEGDDG